ncbi:YybH family protein [Chitinophaga nivalis]|uniref:DUF4440 domain-containing protein n=1 Tax=Chitinophaga nivalis TaxID=2991709 RepID=A0ABT3ITX7_9BACT|nr:hypothetical protein [Chitinophaga nivalis]MCW3463161.1 hypothetical protein [Chitinophaga nivalis]MCW3487149.1 hypothetical protein [Chitinophaga nivalis]
METYDRKTPAGAVAYFRHRLQQGDITGAMSCFDAQGTYIERDGTPIKGLPQIERAIGNLCVLRPTIKGGVSHVTIWEDLSVWLDKWEMTAISPDGHSINMSGHTSCLLKRNEAGIWLWLVDNPFGAAVLDI